jgi:hypothetical protein
MGFLSALARISLDMTVVTLLIIYLPGVTAFWPLHYHLEGRLLVDFLNTGTGKLEI